MNRLTNGVQRKRQERVNGAFKWAQPLPLSSGPAVLPEIPPNALPLWCERHVQSVTQAVQVPRSLPVMLALSTMAGALQKAAEVRMKDGYTEPLILWTCSVLPSGERKSPTFAAMTAAITAHERAERDRLAEHHSQAVAEREVLEGQFERAKKVAAKSSDMAPMHEARKALEAHEVPTLPRLWVNDVTPESLAKEMQAQGGRMLMMSPEGGIFTYMSGRYTQAVSLDLYKKGWTGQEAFRDTRMGRENNDIADPALSVGVCTQPEVLRRLQRAQKFRGEGVLARFLWCYPKSLVGYRDGPFTAPERDGKVAAEYERNIRRLLQLPRLEEPPQMRVTDDAAAIHEEFFNSIEVRVRPDGDLRHVKDWANKLPGQVARIAGVLAIAEEGRIPSTIVADPMLRAIKIGKACIPHALSVFGLIGADERTELARYVLERIHAKWEPQFTKADLWRACRDKVELSRPDDLDEPLKMLQECEHIRLVEQKSTGPGRPPSDLVDLNPKSANTRI